MRVAIMVLLFTLLTLAQDSPVSRGVLVRRDSGVKSGEFSVRSSDSRVVRYHFDAQTYVERDNRAIDTGQLRPGDPVEVVSEAMPGASLRAARSIHVIPPAPPRPHLTTLPVRAGAAAIAKGNLTFSGLILRLTESRLLLHQRDGSDREILLRPDTRYADNGETVAAASLKPGMRIFVRGAKTEEGEVEAYQVVWGNMLAPDGK